MELRLESELKCLWKREQRVASLALLRTAIKRREKVSNASASQKPEIISTLKTVQEAVLPGAVRSQRWQTEPNRTEPGAA